MARTSLFGTCDQSTRLASGVVAAHANPLNNMEKASRGANSHSELVDPKVTVLNANVRNGTRCKTCEWLILGSVFCIELRV